MSDLLRLLAAHRKAASPVTAPPRIPEDHRDSAAKAYEAELPSMPPQMTNFAEEVAPAEAMNIPIKVTTDPFFGGQQVSPMTPERQKPPPYVGSRFGKG